MIIGALLIGFVAGALTFRSVTKKRIRQIMNTDRPPKYAEHLEKELAPTKEQEAPFDSIMETHRQKIRQIRRGERQKMRHEIDTLMMGLKQISNHEQLERLKKVEERMKQKQFRRKRHEGRHHTN